mgnify:CR=1 FL=1
MKTSKILIPAVAAMAASVIAPGVLATSAMAATPATTASAPAPAPAPAPRRTLERITNGPLDGVYMTHDPGASCTTTNPTQMSVQYHCTNVGRNLVGDAMFVHVPNNHFSIDATGRAMPDVTDTQLVTTLRDYMNTNMGTKDGDYTYDGSEIWSSFLGWGIGAEGETGAMAVTITVTRTS